MLALLVSSGGILFASSCGVGSPAGVDASIGPDASVDVLDVDSDASDANTDVGVSAWDCTKSPVVCGDAGYFITVNGDGPQQVFRSNHQPLYPFPVARLVACGEGCLTRWAWGADVPDGGREIDLSPAGSAWYRNGSVYSSGIGDAQADVVVTRWDPPGGIATGTYAVTLESADGGVVTLWGDFRACRTCDDQPPP